MVYDESQKRQRCDYIGAVYVENNIKLSWLTGSGTNYDENQVEHYVSNCTNAIYIKNEVDLPWLIKSGLVYHENQIGQ